jgi:hypothetical protein
MTPNFIHGVLFLLLLSRFSILSVSISADTHVDQREIMSHSSTTLPVPALSMPAPATSRKAVRPLLIPIRPQTNSGSNHVTERRLVRMDGEGAHDD